MDNKKPTRETKARGHAKIHYCHQHDRDLIDNGDDYLRPWLPGGRSVYWRWRCPVKGCDRATGYITKQYMGGFC